jgi:hypothetical protein
VSVPGVGATDPALFDNAGIYNTIIVCAIASLIGAGQIH